MKYVSFFIIVSWTGYILFYNPNLKPSDNYFLWILSIASIWYSIFAFADLINDLNLINKKEK